MGAGVQRWWRTDSKHFAECAVWLARQGTILDRRVIDATRRDLSKVRPVIEAYIELWKVVRTS